MLADAWLLAVLAIRGSFSSVGEVGDLIVDGTKSVMAALLIVALAYALNAVTSELGAGEYIVEPVRAATSHRTRSCWQPFF